MRLQSRKDNFANAVVKSVQDIKNNAFLDLKNKVLIATTGTVGLVKKVVYDDHDKKMPDEVKIISREVLSISKGKDVILGTDDMHIEDLGTFPYANAPDKDQHIPNFQAVLSNFMEQPDVRFSISVKDLKLAISNMESETVTLNLWFDREATVLNKNYVVKKSLVVTPWNQEEYQNMALVTLKENIHSYEDFNNRFNDDQFKLLRNTEAHLPKKKSKKKPVEESTEE